MIEIHRILQSYNDLKLYTLDVHPVPKPRMVKSDSYKKRDVVVKYWKYKDAIIKESRKVNLKSLPGCIPMIIFYVKIPKSNRKKIKENDPVLVRPDLDNYIKAIFDCLECEDNYIHTFSAAKRYSNNPRIEIYLK